MAGMTSAFGLMSNDDDDGANVAGHRRGNAGAEAWIEGMVLMAESEYNTITSLLTSLSPPSSTATIQSTFSRILRSPLSTFSIQFSSIHSHIRRHLITHTFFALDLLGAMQGTSTLGNGSAANRWDNIMLTCAGKGRESGRDEGADGAIMTETILSIRGTLMQVFPKFIEDIRIMPGMREGEVPSTTVNEITYSGLKFIKQLVDYRDVVSPLLQTLGAGNWMMSRGILSSQLGETGEQLLVSAMRSANTSYLDAWGPVVSALMDEQVQPQRGAKLAGLGGGGEKAAVKDRFA
ncbi:hypothetical protein L7F22_043114 [Adiantum nelumboides]|nr:hypothetical protein [Adiantum nelumboides]